MSRVAVVCPYPERRAPSQRLKFEQYYPSWREAGYDVRVYPFWDERAWDSLYREGHWGAKAGALARGYRRRRAELDHILDSDLIYLHLEAAPIGPPWMERRLLSSGVPVVYDLDDLVHLPHGSSANPFMRYLRSSSRVELCLRDATEVVVCTPHLEAHARRFNDRVTDISSTIDTDRYQPRPLRHDEPLVIGWSGSHSTSRYLHLLAEVLETVAQQRSIRVLVIGDPDFSLEGIDVEARAWAEQSEVADLSRIDIGVYPLPDEQWVLGKSGLKALQYMALGIPTVAQRIGAATRIIEDGVSGFLVDTREQWTEALLRLLGDPDLRAAVGAAGRRVVEARYSVRANQAAYLGVLDRALDRTSQVGG